MKFQIVIATLFWLAFSGCKLRGHHRALADQKAQETDEGVSTEQIEKYQWEALSCTIRAFSLKASKSQDRVSRVAGCFLTIGWDLNELQKGIKECSSSVASADFDEATFARGMGACLKKLYEKSKGLNAALAASSNAQQCAAAGEDNALVSKEVESIVDKHFKKLPLYRAIFSCASTALRGAVLLGKLTAETMKQREQMYQSIDDVSKAAEYSLSTSSNLRATAMQYACTMQANGLSKSDCEDKCVNSVTVYTSKLFQGALSAPQYSKFAIDCKSTCGLTASESPSWLAGLIGFEKEITTPCQAFLRASELMYFQGRIKFRRLPSPPGSDAVETYTNMLTTRMRVLHAVEWIRLNWTKLAPERDPDATSSQQIFNTPPERIFYKNVLTIIKNDWARLNPQPGSQPSNKDMISNSNEKFNALKDSDDPDARLVAEVFGSDGPSWVQKVGQMGQKKIPGSVYLHMLVTAGVRNERYPMPERIGYWGDGFTLFELLSFKHELDQYFEGCDGSEFDGSAQACRKTMQ